MQLAIRMRRPLRMANPPGCGGRFPRSRRRTAV